jgi:predicted acylesterase/phospholipase RssA
MITTAFAIYREATVIAALSKKDPQQLRGTWDETVARVRAGGESSADNAATAAQFFPCLMAKRDDFLSRLTGDARAGCVGEEKIADVQRRLQNSFAHEFAKQSELKFTNRMRYMAMDDFLCVQDFWARRELAIEGPQQPIEKIDFVSFAGGGSRGIGYLATVEMFSKGNATAVLSKDCCFAGSSSGAIAAAMAAFGEQNARERTDAMQEAVSPFRRNHNLHKAYPGLHNNMHSGIFSWYGMVEFADKFTSAAVADFVKTFQPHQLEALSADKRKRIEQLAQPFDTSANREPFMVKFSDISLLRELSGGADRFHPLFVLIWNADVKKDVVCSHMTTPDLPVAYALRASISLPVLAKMLTLRITNADGTVEPPQRFCDGGVGQEVPSCRSLSAFAEFRNPLHLVLEGDGRAYSKQPSQCDPVSETPYRQLMWLLDVAGDDLPERRRRNRDALKNENVFAVPHGTVRTSDFWASKTQLDAAYHQSRIATARKMCELYRGQPIRDFD